MIERHAFDGTGALVRTELRVGSREQRIDYHPVLSEVPDVVPEALMRSLRVEERAEIHGASSVHVVDSSVLRAVYPDMHLVRGTHETSYMEYHQLHSLAVAPSPGAPPRRVLERTMTADGWPAFVASFAGVQLASDEQARDLARTLAVILQPLVDPASVDAPVPLEPRASDGRLEVALGRGSRRARLVLEIDPSRRLTAVRLD